MVAGLVAPSKVVAVALNTSLIPDPDEARRAIAATETETGLPCEDPFRFGPQRLWPRVRAAVESLPRVGAAAGRRHPEPYAPGSTRPSARTVARRRRARSSARGTWSRAWYDERTRGPDSTWRKPIARASRRRSANSSGW